ncbi:hypothetical protein J5N58_08425 [Rhizobium cremeum]|nr:hypothetical protein [Rhizobium cremeum]MCJ7995944.1 hypothetical protein [Rhizobium cremeum]MCJ7999699.1 hypothetical protein [Rhizobium cremeum]
MAYVQTQSRRSRCVDSRRFPATWSNMCGVAAVIGSVAFVALLTVAL